MTLLRKLPDWEDRLHAYLALVRATPFDWATHACVHFTAHCVGAMTGYTPISGILSKVTSKEMAKEVLAKTYGTNLQQAVAAFAAEHGLEEVRLNYHTIGDLCVINDGGLNTLSVCTGINAVGPSEKGLQPVDIRHATQIWRIRLMSF